MMRQKSPMKRQKLLKVSGSDGTEDSSMKRQKLPKVSDSDETGDNSMKRQKLLQFSDSDETGDSSSMKRQKSPKVSDSDETEHGVLGDVIFKRFTLNQVVQHWVMMGAFSLLVISGMPLVFPDVWVSPIIVNLLGGFEMRTQIHHISGIVMILLGAYHVAYYTFVDKKPLIERKILPNLKDAQDFWQAILYYIGEAEPPKYDRYSWKEKFDYWGAVQGTVVMVVTGLIMMFPFVAMKYMPPAYVHLSTISHTYWAIMDTAFIVIVHWWNVHYSPEVFPMSKAWITGNLSEDQMKHEHMLEYEEIMRKMQQKTERKDKVLRVVHEYSTGHNPVIVSRKYEGLENGRNL
jgi:formate dehydrogenase subunit gamma